MAKSIQDFLNMIEGLLFDYTDSVWLAKLQYDSVVNGQQHLNVELRTNIPFKITEYTAYHPDIEFDKEKFKGNKQLLEDFCQKLIVKNGKIYWNVSDIRDFVYAGLENNGSWDGVYKAASYIQDIDQIKNTYSSNFRLYIYMDFYYPIE